MREHIVAEAIQSTINPDISLAKRTGISALGFWLVFLLPAPLVAVLSVFESDETEIALAANAPQVLVDAAKQIASNNQLAAWGQVACYALFFLLVAIRWNRKFYAPSGIGEWLLVVLAWIVGLAAAILGDAWVAHLFAVLSLTSWLACHQERESERSLIHLTVLPIFALGLPLGLNGLAVSILQEWSVSGGSRLLDISGTQHVPTGYLVWVASEESTMQFATAKSSSWLMLTSWMITLSCVWRGRSIAYWLLDCGTGYLLLYVLLPTFTTIWVLQSEGNLSQTVNSWWNSSITAFNILVLVIGLGVVQRLLNILLAPIQDDFGVDNGAIVIWNFFFAGEKVPSVDELHHDIDEEDLAERTKKLRQEFVSRGVLSGVAGIALAIVCCWFLVPHKPTVPTAPAESNFQGTIVGNTLSELVSAIKWQGWREVASSEEDVSESAFVFRNLQLEVGRLVTNLPNGNNSSIWNARNTVHFGWEETSQPGSSDQAAAEEMRK